jgi:hypothetical protein
MQTINAGAQRELGAAEVVPYRLFEDFVYNNISAGAFRAYGLLALWKHQGRYEGWPSQLHLATAMNTTRRSVARYLAELGDKGYLERIHRVPKARVEYCLTDGVRSNNDLWST